MFFSLQDFFYINFSINCLQKFCKDSSTNFFYGCFRKPYMRSGQNCFMDIFKKVHQRFFPRNSTVNTLGIPPLSIPLVLSEISPIVFFFRHHPRHSSSNFSKEFFRNFSQNFGTPQGIL